MDKENRKRLKDIIQHKDLEINLPAYANSFVNSAYEYSMIGLVLNYYTMKEVQDERGKLFVDATLSNTIDKVNTIIFQTILSQDIKEDIKSVLDQIHTLRNTMTDKMQVLTAYTDTLQIYEYVLNRIEYGITGQTYEVDGTELAVKVFQYLFRDNDKMVVNSKIQMVTGQLPIRMTKNRFYDYLTDTLNIYNGSSRSSVDNFVSMLKSTAVLDIPKGYGEDYPEIVKTIELLKSVNYKELDLATYQAVMEQFSMTTTHLTEIVSDYLLAMDVINNLYAVLLAIPYEKSEAHVKSVCIDMLQGLHDAYVSDSDIPESVDEGFMKLEGVQEMLGEDIMQYESILPDVMETEQDTISWMMSGDIFDSLNKMTKLLSNSVFVDLNHEEDEDVLADTEYITEKRDEIVGLLTTFFAENPKEVNRAVMASMFASMPVLFNSQQEVKEYIEYSLNHCSNQSELMACAKILQDLMDEE